MRPPRAPQSKTAQLKGGLGSSKRWRETQLKDVLAIDFSALKGRNPNSARPPRGRPTARR